MEKEKLFSKEGMRRQRMTLVCLICTLLSSLVAQVNPPIFEPVEAEAVYILEFTDN